MEQLKDRTVVITGAASGIGRALARRFASEGSRLMLADIDTEALAGVVSELAPQTAVASRACDVADPEQVEALAEDTVNALGVPHVVCNNAGVFAAGTLWEAPLTDYRWLMGVNQWGVINGIRSFVPRMVAAGESGHVVNTASMAALTTLPFAGIYHMTKHAVLALSECLYHELALTAPQLGVSVLCPELIDTAIFDSERVRPESCSNSTEASDTATATLTTARDAAAKHGLNPAVMADRVVAAIRARRFYILSDDAWWDSAAVRMEDIQLRRNPTLAPPESH